MRGGGRSYEWIKSVIYDLEQRLRQKVGRYKEQREHGFRQEKTLNRATFSSEEKERDNLRALLQQKKKKKKKKNKNQTNNKKITQHRVHNSPSA